MEVEELNRLKSKIGEFSDRYKISCEVDKRDIRIKVEEYSNLINLIEDSITKMDILDSNLYSSVNNSILINELLDRIMVNYAYGFLLKGDGVTNNVKYTINVKLGEDNIILSMYKNNVKEDDKNKEILGSGLYYGRIMTKLDEE